MKNIYVMILMCALTLRSMEAKPSHKDIDKNIITFQPAHEFKGTGMVGLYLKNKATATISDPKKETRTCIFVFEKVVEEDTTKPEDLTYMGSYKPSDNSKKVNLYGVLRAPLWK